MSEYQRLVLKALRLIIRWMYLELLSNHGRQFHKMEYDEAIKELKQ